MTAEPLFPDDGLRVAPEEQTAGERLRERQAARIANGCHPLSTYGVAIPLHADAPRTAYRGDPREYPRCGDCRFREQVGGHARAFPKCLYGYQAPLVSTAPRYSAGQATDVRSWWPACEDYEPREPA